MVDVLLASRYGFAMRRLSTTCALALLGTACGGDGEDAAGSAGSAGVGAAGAGGAAGVAGAAGTGGIPPPQPRGCIDDVSAGDHVWDCDGHAYDARVPEACLTEACGLIFDVHGFSMSGAMQDANTRLKQRGEERGYLVVEPNAVPAPPLSSWDPAVDDDKVFAVLETVAEVFHVDADRIHFTGFSQGGAMTWRMLCDHADVLASVAPGAAGGCFSAGEAPSRELPTLFLAGTNDALVSFTEVAIPQRDAVVAAWDMDAGEQIDGGDDWKRTRYTSPSGNVFELLQHDWVAGPCLIAIDGHCFPGSDDPGGLAGQACSFACLPPNAFDWGEEIIEFFEAHPRSE